MNTAPDLDFSYSRPNPNLDASRKSYQKTKRRSRKTLVPKAPRSKVHGACMRLYSSAPSIRERCRAMALPGRLTCHTCEQVLMRMFSLTLRQPCEKENCACARPHVRKTTSKRVQLTEADAPLTDLFAPTTELSELV